MRNLVIFGAQGAPLGTLHGRLTVDGVTVRCAIVRTPRPDFDPTAPAHARHVLVRTRAVSCNYRDRAFVYAMRQVPARRFTPIGSEYSGEVVAVGSEVRTLVLGDRVLTDHHYVDGGMSASGARQGVVTNQGSREYHVVPAAKLARVPDVMPDDVAATFGLAAQTAYGMVRRATVAPGMTALVMGGSSNTSLYLIGALRAAGLRVCASTTSESAVPRLLALGVYAVVCLRHDRAAAREALAGFAAEHSGFERVFDPFFDVNLAHALEVLRPCGEYVTCGLAGQNAHQAAAAGVEGGVDGVDVLLTAMRKNLTLHGNCLGLSGDLSRALDDYASGRLLVPLDATYTGEDVSAFFDRTFNARDRFGKVAYCYGRD